MGRINILTGEIHSGKTSLCLELAEYADQRGTRLGGLLSPGVYAAGVQTAIDVVDLKNGQRRRLAELKGSHSSEMETQRWAFLPDAVDWGNQALKKAGPCELLLIDELGPLEFFQGVGWVNGFDALNSGGYQSALVVIRPSLLEEASRRWKIARIIDLSDPAGPQLSAAQLYQQLLEG